RHRRGHRQSYDGGRRVLGHSVRRCRFWAHRRLPHVAGDARVPPQRALRRLDAVRRRPRWSTLAVAVLAAAAVALPLVVANRFAIDIAIRVLLFAFIGVAWNLMGGYAKQLSLGHAAYFGLGAYTSPILLLLVDMPLWLGQLACRVRSVLGRLPVGALCFRAR